MQAIRSDRQLRPILNLFRIGSLLAAVLLAPALSAGSDLHALARQPDSAPLEAALSVGPTRSRRGSPARRR